MSKAFDNHLGRHYKMTLKADKLKPNPDLSETISSYNWLFEEFPTFQSIFQNIFLTLLHQILEDWIIQKKLLELIEIELFFTFVASFERNAWGSYFHYILRHCKTIYNILYWKLKRFLVCKELYELMVTIISCKYIFDDYCRRLKNLVNNEKES